jgi:uncharacterized protein YoxC
VTLLLSSLVVLCSGLLDQPSAADAPATSPHAQEASPSNPPQAAPASPAPADIDRRVAEWFERHTKDKDVVEVGLAMKAADLLVGWVKIFGLFVVVPGALLLAVLSWFGISTIKDAREKGNQVNATLAEVRRIADQVGGAQTEAQALLAKTSETNARVESQWQQLQGVVAQYEQRTEELDRLQTVVAQNEQRIEALDNTVKEILEFAPDAKLSSTARNRMSRSLNEFRQYFESLGYKPSDSEKSKINVRTDDPDHHLQRGIIAFYNPEHHVYQSGV